MAKDSYARTRFVDAADTPVEFVAGDANQLRLRWPGGTEITIQASMLAAQADGSFRLPFALQTGGEDGGSAVFGLIEERLQVDRRTDDTGGIRIDKRVETQAVEQVLELASEQVHVERVARETVVREDELPVMHEDGDTLVIPVLEERLVVTKQIILKEELRVTRKRSMRTEMVNENLRREQADVVRLGGKGREASS